MYSRTRFFFHVDHHFILHAMACSFHTNARRILVLLPVLFLIGCGQRATDEFSDVDSVQSVQRTAAELPDSIRSRTFSPMFRSPDSLVAAFLRAVALRDADALRSLLVNEHEFQHWLWPEFPMSDPAMNVPEGFAWTNLAIKSDKGLRRILRELGGQRLSLTATRFIEEEEKYRSFTIQGGTRIDVLDDQGKSAELAYVGSVVALNGSYKFMSYRE
jgi:hypothetical protein